MPTAVAIDPQEKVSQAIRQVTSIATLPEVTQRIIATVEDPRSTASQLHKIVSHDPALVTRVLKVVNSAFYGLPGQIGSIERAIVLLGLNAVKNIAVAASLGQLFRGVTLCNGFSAKDLWTHCVAVAVVTRELARQVQPAIADEAFLAGMIHDVGILLELQNWPEQMRAACEVAGAGDSPRFVEVERQRMGVDHQMLGQALAEQWKFTRSCQLVAGRHHDPTSLADGNRQLVCLVYVADTLCCQAQRGFHLTAKGQSLDAQTLSELNIDPSIVDRTRDGLDALLRSAVEVMG